MLLPNAYGEVLFLLDIYWTQLRTVIYISHTLICFMLAADRALSQTIDLDLSTHEEVINLVQLVAV
jgi:hypothetical protein